VYTEKLTGMDSYTDVLLTQPQTPNLGVSTGLNLQAWEASQLRTRNNEATQLFTNAHFFQNAVVQSVAPNMAAISSRNLHITKFREPLFADLGFLSCHVCSLWVLRARKQQHSLAGMTSAMP
jgi:hypothetical protein